jgi:hypothetical protein
MACRIIASLREPQPSLYFIAHLGRVCERVSKRIVEGAKTKPTGETVLKQETDSIPALQSRTVHPTADLDFWSELHPAAAWCANFFRPQAGAGPIPSTDIPQAGAWGCDFPPASRALTVVVEENPSKLTAITPD